MRKNNIEFDDFLKFKTITGGGCLVTVLSLIGTVGLLIMLVF